MIISIILLFFLILYFLQVFNPKRKEKYSSLNSKSPDTFPLVYRSQAKVLAPIPLQNKTRGRSEDYFLEFLWKYFPTYIQVDLALPLKNEFYFPDFAFIDKKNTLYIDIEVDEPYSLKSGYPTHCLGKDDFRNKYFLKNGWWVIRFTEEQVVRQPKACCKVIAKVVAKETNDDQLLNRFFDVDDLSISQKQWTVQQAERMYKMGYREKYAAIMNKF